MDHDESQKELKVIYNNFIIVFNKDESQKELKVYSVPSHKMRTTGG